MKIIGQFFICANLQNLRHLRAFKTASSPNRGEALVREVIRSDCFVPRTENRNLWLPLRRKKNAPVKQDGQFILKNDKKREWKS